LTSLPTALIDFPYVYYKDSTAKVQLGYAMVKVMLCVDVSSLSGAGVTNVFELKDKIYAKVQGTRKQTVPPYPVNDKPKYTPMTRGTERTETKYAGDGIYVFEMDFYTTIQDDGVYRLKNFVNANDPLINTHLNRTDTSTENDYVGLEIIKKNKDNETI